MVTLKEITTFSQSLLNIIHRVTETSEMFLRIEEMMYSSRRTLVTSMLRHSLVLFRQMDTIHLK